MAKEQTKQLSGLQAQLAAAEEEATKAAEQQRVAKEQTKQLSRLQAQLAAAEEEATKAAEQQRQEATKAETVASSRGDRGADQAAV